MKFNEYKSSVSQVVPCGLTQIDRQTDMTNLLVAFRNFANAPEEALQNAKQEIKRKGN
jgi:hypothetical protein